tara:strand:+ start:810 stop:1304 length:495 start_codon:yes stop_codon:yes gene_type:complete
MTTPKDLVPERYEVIKLKSGTEVVGMTRDCGDHVEITLPMICQLSLIPGTPRTNAVFYPYAPLSADEMVKIPNYEIVHRNIMNEQFVPYYDDASSRWFEMIENKSIPLASAEDRKVSEIMRRSLDRILTRAPNDEFIEEALEEMDLELEEFETSIAPTDKKKLH